MRFCCHDQTPPALIFCHLMVPCKLKLLPRPNICGNLNADASARFSKTKMLWMEWYKEDETR